MTGPDDIAALRAAGKLDWGQVPLVEMNGKNLVQGVATAVYIGQSCGLFPSGADDGYTATNIYCAAGDARGAMLSFPWHGDKAKATEAFKMERYAGGWEAMLAKTDGPFFLASASIADVAVYECLAVYKEIAVKLLESAPLLAD